MLTTASLQAVRQHEVHYEVKRSDGLRRATRHKNLQVLFTELYQFTLILDRIKDVPPLLSTGNTHITLLLRRSTITQDMSKADWYVACTTPLTSIETLLFDEDTGNPWLEVTVDPYIAAIFEAQNTTWLEMIRTATNTTAYFATN